MSVDMSSQASDSIEEDFEEEENEGAEEEDQGDMTYYYEGVAGDVEQAEPDAFDPEEYQFTCLTYRESQRLLTEEVNHVSSSLKVCVCCVCVWLLSESFLGCKMEESDCSFSFCCIFFLNFN